MQQCEINTLMALAAQARTLPDAWQAVDPERQVFLARIGKLRETAPVDADRQAQALGDQFRQKMQAIIQAGRFIAPANVSPEMSPQQRAATVLESARTAGVEITAHRDGTLEITPASKLPRGLDSVVAELREQIVAALRKDVLVIPAPKHRAGVAA